MQFVEEKEDDVANEHRCQSQKCKISLSIFFIAIIAIAVVLGIIFGKVI